jgi:hypothetical protein
MEKLITGKTAALISPDYTDLTDTRPIIDWRQIIRRQSIVYVGLDALSDIAVAAAVGNSMFADLVSVSEMPMIAPATVMALPKCQAFALLEGGQLWKIRMPLPTKTNDTLLPNTLKEVAEEMNRRYMTSDHWWAG